MAKQGKELTVNLDGTLVGAFHEKLAARLKAILDLAIAHKKAGIGVFARPEADAGIVKLLHVLHKLEPDGGWLEKALVAYTWTLDDCLREPGKFWWGHDWLDPLQDEWDFIRERKSAPSMVEEFAVAATKDKSPKRAQRLLIAEALARRLSVVQGTTPPLDRPGTISWEECFVRLLVRAVSKAPARKESPSLERPRPGLLAADPLPFDFPAPPWRNASFPDWPVTGKAHREKLGLGLMRGVMNWADCAMTLFTSGGGLLGEMPRKFASPKRYSASSQFASMASLTTDDAFTRQMPILDRIFGGSAELFLTETLGASRLAASHKRWLNRQDAWNGLEAPLISNDDAHLRAWAEHVEPASLPVPVALRRNLGRLQRFILGVRTNGPLKQGPLKGQYEDGYRLAITGLLSRDVNSLNAGVAKVLASWGKTDEGRFLPFLNLPAIAFQRAALRIGMRPAASEGLPNDPTIVRMPDPKQPTALYNLLPGAGRVLANPGLDWPSLLLDETILGHFDSRSEPVSASRT